MTTLNKHNRLRCPYCGKDAVRTTGQVIYPHLHELHAKPFYQCAPCDAWVGCHPGTVRPLGSLANAELRQARQAAHSAFDHKWRSGAMSRAKAYTWLAKQLGLPGYLCHIAMFSVATCERVVSLCMADEFDALP